MFTLDKDIPLHIQVLGSMFFYYITCKECVNGVWVDARIRVKLPNQTKPYLPISIVAENMVVPRRATLSITLHNRNTAYPFAIATFETYEERIQYGIRNRNHFE